MDANTTGLYIETSPVTSLRSKESIMSTDKLRPWTFNVVVNEDLMPNERIAITGSCESLGLWKPGHCVLLNQGEDGEFFFFKFYKLVFRLLVLKCLGVMMVEFYLALVFQTLLLLIYLKSVLVSFTFNPR